MQTFRPSWYLRSPHVQSILASSWLRCRLDRLRGRRLDPGARECVLDCGSGVRLQGFLSEPPDDRPVKGLVVLLHGWEGSARSSYILSAGSHLLERGYRIFRLNFRDHGETHHLNEEIFHSCRLQEVVDAVGQVARRFPARPFFLVGFSLGGNFALRVARSAPDAGLRLTHVVSVSPVIDPQNCLVAIERAPRFYERYFVNKWRRSLLRKQELFPERYDFAEWMRLGSLRELTRQLVQRHTEFGSLEAYLRGYSIAGSALAGLTVPSTVITAADDPIIPVEDLQTLEPPANMRLEIQRRGGHSGYLSGLSLRSWIDARTESILDAATEAGRGTGGLGRGAAAL